MKLKFLLPLLFLSLFCKAQTRYIDDLFQPKKAIEKVYATKDSEQLKLYVYEPKNDSTEKRPVIIFMHGGGFGVGSPYNPAEVKFAKECAKKGYVAVQIGYRLTRKGKGFGCDYSAEGKRETFKKAAEDYLDAVKYMIQHQEEFNIDPNQIIAGGSSAGAEAVLHAVYQQNLLFEDASAYENIKFSGLFSLAGAMLDVRYLNKENTTPAVFFHGTADNLVPYATAPHHCCDKNAPGYLILDGSKTIAERLKQLETSYLLYTFKEAKHEISSIPFAYLNQVFPYFKEVFLEKKHIQSEVTIE